MPRGFHALIAAQFCSALADNALLIVAIAWLAERQMSPWLAPMLKFGFTLAYVVGAPFVGPLADALPKARLMAWMNGVKVLGVVALLAGVHPLAAFAVVGIGAAAYAPAKYGLITELVPVRQLVAANAWIEVTVVGAALFGTVLGGALVGNAWLQSPLVAAVLQALPLAAGAGALQASLLVLLGVYALAAGLNTAVPDSGARYPRASRRPAQLVQEFAIAQRTLWRDPEGGLSLAATTLFWGIGATLQFVVLRWAVESLGLTLERAAYLQGTVALGVVIGAVAAGTRVPIAAAPRMLGFGVALGLAMPVLAAVRSLPLAVALLVVVGAVGGLMVVPLNALLQHRGCVLLSAGRSVAVQGFNENASVLAMLLAYAALVRLELPIGPVMAGFGLAIAGAIMLLMRRRQRWLSAPRGADRPASAGLRSVR